MKLRDVYLDGYRTAEGVRFRAAPLTVLFGRNNAGKTNILEAVYAALHDPATVVRRSHADRSFTPFGAFEFAMGDASPFDKRVESSLAASGLAPQDHVLFWKEGLAPGVHVDSLTLDFPWQEDQQWLDAATSTIEPQVTLRASMLDWDIQRIHQLVEDSAPKLVRGDAYRGRDAPWLTTVRDAEGNFAYRINPAIERIIDQVGSLATSLLPDFVDCSIGCHVTSADLWNSTPRVTLEFNQRGLKQCADTVELAGHGAARWIAAAVQIAIDLLDDHPGLEVVSQLEDGALDGRLLLVDEPEANLHASAVTSVSRWTERMTRYGYTVFVATHHEEFLRNRTIEWELVHITRSEDLLYSEARNIEVRTVEQLRELALDVGMPPAAILSLYQAILFVEGPLDEAVLDEYGRLQLDSAGIKIVPIHGTKNLEGVVTGELVTQLHIKTAVLTDATVVGTMYDRSNRKRSSEEKKVLRILEIAARNNVAEPKVFGVPEDDLLFAIPVQAINSEYLKGKKALPDWKQLVRECRDEQSASPNQSVNWKEYAHRMYGVPLDTEEGVRELVRCVDLAGVALPSISRVLSELQEWVKKEASD
ncbi:ATP-dependent nuclease [Gordonia alkanivorans]|nr:TOPRIM nucleotidyl transferase/hydrolase domain-containing protein [Gordonia alkanivorans]MDH3010069.1 AAA family ATPase [Gordonia alkanivorans]